jgi:YD repeat-containing protein
LAALSAHPGSEGQRCGRPAERHEARRPGNRNAPSAAKGGGGDGPWRGRGYQTIGQPDVATLGPVAGDFQGSTTGLEVAVPVTNGGGYDSYLDIVPLSSAGAWGSGTTNYAGSYTAFWTGSGTAGTIVAADLNGAGKPSIALSTGDTGQIDILLADPASNQFLPLETIDVTSAFAAGMLAVAPFMGTPANESYNGPTSDPSTLIQHENGSWTRTYPDGTVIQFNSSGQETSITDVNGNEFTYTYVTSGAAAGALATITDPVGLTTTLAYNESGYISTITDPAEAVTTFTLDDDGNLTAVEGPNGSTTDYGYSTPSDHLATSETDPDGNTATAHNEEVAVATFTPLAIASAWMKMEPRPGRSMTVPIRSWTSTARAHWKCDI